MTDSCTSPCLPNIQETGPSVSPSIAANANHVPGKAIADKSIIESYVNDLHALARAHSVHGLFPVMALRLDANGKTVSTNIEHFSVGQSQPMTDYIYAQASIHGTNVYAPLAVFDSSIGKGKKGGETDIVKVLGAVADFDDANAADWANRSPTNPSMVLETSPGRFQVFYFFDTPLKLAEAKPILAGIQQSCGCDFGTKDASHVWRVPGTHNWPDDGKIKKGRNADGAPVKTIAAWNGSTVPHSTLPRAKASSAKTSPASQPITGAVSKKQAQAIFSSLPIWLQDKIANAVPVGKRSDIFYSATLDMKTQGFSEAEVIAVFSLHPKGPASKHTTAGNLTADVMRIYSKAPATAPSGVGRFTLLKPGDLANLPPPSWLIENIITDSSFGILYGDSYVGKSFVALDWALRVASGQNWGPHKVTRGNVVYIYAEGQRGLKKRHDAWVQRNSPTGRVDIRFIAESANISSQEDRDHLIHELQQAEFSPSLIFVDTLTQCFGDGDENTAQGMGAFVRGIGEIRKAFPNSTVVVIHHTGKDASRGARGSSVLRAAVDFSFELSKDRGGILLTCEKMKDEEAFDPIPLELVPVQLPDGRKSCVVDFRHSQGVSVAPVNRSPKMSLKTKTALTVLTGFGAMGATAAEWKSSSGLKRQTFNDALKKLVKAGLVVEDAPGHYRAVDEPAPTVGDVPTDQKKDGVTDGAGPGTGIERAA